MAFVCAAPFASPEFRVTALTERGADAVQPAADLGAEEPDLALGREAVAHEDAARDFGAVTTERVAAGIAERGAVAQSCPPILAPGSRTSPSAVKPVRRNTPAVISARSPLSAVPPALRNVAPMHTSCPPILAPEPDLALGREAVREEYAGRDFGAVALQPLHVRAGERQHCDPGIAHDWHRLEPAVVQPECTHLAAALEVEVTRHERAVEVHALLMHRHVCIAAEGQEPQERAAHLALWVVGIDAAPADLALEALCDLVRWGQSSGSFARCFVSMPASL
ncbi:MAG: hypothetical protein R3D44_10865 [Hyphomicrobiaceae bacterium]